ncbi:MAG: hypothetical protein EOS70_18570 [Mesorhizobium sp.]|uniref:hypothetical protein n=1 Tax=Mesorhizobium sp. TaxID=1871066 RepID=UPI000FE997DC|nr:hypothetical protein [Mesorhizobium sp.]RWC32105.1 MAG: hypothetical protein EOS70_18570 [Mesorhizobium sp.]RWF57866.1 MAG: hypothetical protein EOS50_05590 [Mesorhizobium sp.]
MMTYKALQIWLYASLSVMLLSNHAWPTEKEVVQAQATKDAAVNYLRSLPHDRKIHVWPSWHRPYEIVAKRLNVRSSIERYKALRGDLNGLLPAIGTAQISIIAADGANWQKDAASALTSSRLLPWYKNFVAKAELSLDGCTAYKFTSRDTWASVGVILINELNFRENGTETLDRCVHAALDYLQGFPTREGYFDYSMLPDARIRGLVIEATYKCAAEGDGTAEPRERTRDGLTPLPSLDCIVAKVTE